MTVCRKGAKRNFLIGSQIWLSRHRKKKKSVKNNSLLLGTTFWQRNGLWNESFCDTIIIRIGWEGKKCPNLCSVTEHTRKPVLFTSNFILSFTPNGKKEIE